MFLRCSSSDGLTGEACAQSNAACAGKIACGASILAAAASPHGGAILQTQSGELLLYEGTSAGQLTKLGSFPEPCPNMHTLPDGESPSLPVESNSAPNCNQALPI